LRHLLKITYIDHGCSKKVIITRTRIYGSITTTLTSGEIYLATSTAS
jgi:hypothetical protein